jgi:hypothetical protein
MEDIADTVAEAALVTDGVRYGDGDSDGDSVVASKVVLAVVFLPGLAVAEDATRAPGHVPDNAAARRY